MVFKCFNTHYEDGLNIYIKKDLIYNIIYIGHRSS